MQQLSTIDSHECLDDENEALAEELVELLREKDKKYNLSLEATVTAKSPPQIKYEDAGERAQSVPSRKCVRFAERDGEVVTGRKRVRFVDIAEIIPTSKRQSHPSKSWYTHKEMNSIFRGVRSLLKKLKHLQYDDSTLEEVQDCLRGLEGVFPILLVMDRDQDSKINAKGSRRQSQHHHDNQKNTFVRAILDWQEDQKSSADLYSLPKSDPVGLRMISISYSEKSRDLALARAAQDFLEVQTLWDNNNDAEEMNMDRKNSWPQINKTMAKQHKNNARTMQSVITEGTSQYLSLESKTSLSSGSQRSYSSLEDHLLRSVAPFGNGDDTESLSSFF